LLFLIIIKNKIAFLLLYVVMNLTMKGLITLLTPGPWIGEGLESFLFFCSFCLLPWFSGTGEDYVGLKCSTSSHGISHSV